MLNYLLVSLIAIAPVAATQEVVPTAEIDVSGRVVTEDGRPIPNATVYLFATRVQQKMLDQTRTDRLGRYEFKGKRLPLDVPPREGDKAKTSGVFEVYAAAMNYGVQWTGPQFLLPEKARVEDEFSGSRRRYGSEDEISLDFILRPRAKLKGRIVDEDGKPIPNAWVGIWSAKPISQGKVFKTTDGFFVSGVESTEIMYVKSVMPDELRNAKVNEEGWFEFAHAPVNSKLWLEVAAPKFGRRKIYAVTTTWDAIGFEEPKVYRDGMVLKFPRPFESRVRVLLGDSGKPADGVFVSLSNTVASQWKLSSEDGLAKLRLPAGEYRMSLLPKDGSPYLGTRTGKLVLKQASDLQTVRIERGAQIFVKVVDADTGDGIRDAQLWVDEKDKAYGYRSFRRPNLSVYNDHKSDGGGNIRAIVKQGKRLIGVRSMPAGYEMVEAVGIAIDAQADKNQRIIIKMKKR